MCEQPWVIVWRNLRWDTETVTTVYCTELFCYCWTSGILWSRRYCGFGTVIFYFVNSSEYCSHKHREWTFFLEIVCMCSTIFYLFWAQILNFAFRLVDIPTPSSVKTVVSETLAVGAPMLLPPLKERMELLHSLLPQGPDLSNGQVRYQMSHSSGRHRIVTLGGP